MPTKLVKRVWNSPTFMTWGNMASTSIKLLILTPLILRNYNVNEIAFWYLLLTINSFIIVMDFGFYPTFFRVISFAYNGLKSLTDVDGKHEESDGKPNWPLVSKIYGTVNSTYLILGLVIPAVIVSFTYFSVQKIILRTDEQQNLWSAYYIYIISVFISFYAKKFDSVIIGTNNVVIINRWDLMNNLLNAFVSILIVYFKLDLIYLCLNQLVFALILVIRDYFLERSICNGKFKEFKFFSFDKDVFKWCWEPVWKSGILILCSTGINQASGFIYSNVSDSAQLAAYLLSLKFISTIASFSQAPFYSKLPRFSGLRVKNHIKELEELSAQSMKKSLFIFVAGMTCLFFFGQWGLTLIKSKASLVDYRMLILMAFVWFFERHHAMHGQIYVTTNKIKLYKAAIATAIINISMMIILLPKIGVLAFPVAQGIANLAISNWWNVYLSITSLHIKFIHFFQRSALYPLLILIITSISRIFI